MDGRQGRQRCQETQHFQMIRGEELMRLLVSEKSVQTAVREISPHQRLMKKETRGRGVCQLRGRQEKQRKDSDGYAVVSRLFYKQPCGAACAPMPPPVCGPSSAGRETRGSRKSPVPQAICYMRGESEEVGINSSLGFRKYTVFRDS